MIKPDSLQAKNKRKSGANRDAIDPDDTAVGTEARRYGSSALPGDTAAGKHRVPLGAEFNCARTRFSKVVKISKGSRQ